MKRTFQTKQINTSFICLVLILLLVSLVFAVTVTWADQDKKPLTLNDVLDMKRAGVGDDLIIDRIRETRTSIDLTVKQIIDLKRKGLSDKVIKELLNGNGTDNRNGPAPTPIPMVPADDSATPAPEMLVEPGRASEGEVPASEEMLDSSSDVLATIDNRGGRKIFKITSQPSKAKVYIDKRYVGVTPYYTNFVIDGKHLLVLRKEYYRDLKVNIDLEDESIQDLHLQMRLEQPLVFVTWLTEKTEYISAFKWSARNCQVAGSDDMIRLEPMAVDLEFEEKYMVHLNDLRGLSPGDVACLEFFVWFKSTWAKKETYGFMPRPDLHFLLTDIPLIFEKPINFGIALQRHNRYPQRTRIILESDCGKLFRMDPRRSAERQK